MDRTRYIDQGGTRVLLLDFSSIADAGEWNAAIAQARALVAARQPDGSLLTLTDVTGVRYDKDVVQTIKALASHNQPYVKAAAVVADSALSRSVISMVAIVTRRPFKAFESRTAALEWLAGQS